MWALDNRTPYGAERNWTRDKYGVHWWIVAVRATYDVASDGKLSLADEQPPPRLAPEYFGDPGKSSLRYDSDLLAAKPGTDLLVLGSAHAPRGRPAATVPVTLRIGPLLKQLVVHGSREYQDGSSSPRASAPEPFVTRPIRYELAFGGTDLSDPDPRNHGFDGRNPVGRGMAVQPDRLAGMPAHCIEYPSGDPRTVGPAGFGPIDPSWLPRLTLAGTYDDRWASSKKPLLPDDYDPAFAMSSPSDQRLSQPLVGGERLELLNMTPNGRLALDLPTVSLSLTSAFGRRREAHPAQLVTVLVEPDDRRLVLVWQSTLRVAAPEADYLDSTEIVENRTTR